MSVIKKIVGVCFIIFNILLSYAQEPIHYFLGKDIFSGVQLYSIIEDTDNTMWITSNKGIFYYDGVNFKSIPVKDSERDAFFGLTKDNNDNIYFHNFSGQIFKITNKNIELFYKLPEKFLGVYLHINFDNLNNLLITSSGNLIKIANTTKKLEFYKGRGFSIQKRNDTLFYGKYLSNNNSVIVSRFNDKENVFQKLPSSLDVQIALHTTLHFHDNNLYAFSANKNRFYLIKNNAVETLPLQLPKGYYYDFYYSNNNFWFPNNKSGVHKVNLQNIKSNNSKKIFEGYRVSGVYNDFEGNTWLLTFDNGIIVIPNLNVSNYKIKNENILQIRKIGNKIYVSTKESSIYNFKKGIFKPFFKANNDRFESFNIFKGRNIITSSTSVYKGNKKIKNAIIFNRGTVLINDSIFVALHAGLQKFDIDKNKVTQIDIRRASNICLSAKKDKIYIASIKGLLRYNFKNIAPITFNGDNIQPKKITSIQNEIWVSSKDGIYIVKDNDIIKNFTTKDGLLSNNIEIIKYEYPYVYITSEKGFQKYNIKTKKFKNLIEDFGLTKRIKNFEVLNDTIYATTSNGLAVFSFNEAKTQISRYETNITEAIANGNKDFKNNASLEPSENNVAFSFLTTSYKYQKKLDYYYQLIGYDKEPFKAKEGQYVVNYSNLPAGNYIFKVQSAINNKKNHPAKIQFSIQQYWYKTSFFRILVILILMLMFYLIYRSRVKEIQRKRKEEQFKRNLAESSLTSLKAQMNPHFLFNAMNSVQSLILKDKKDKAYTYLTKLSQLIRETLNMSEKTWVYLDEELDQLTNYLELEKLRFSSDFTYEIKINENLESLKIPSMIIQPFVENSVKHGLLHKDYEKYIHIVFSMKNELLTCSIQDNGIGREASKKINSLKPNYQTSFSTVAIQKRFELYKDYLKVNAGFEYEDLLDDQNNATGTRVIINIPYKVDEN